MNTDGQDNKLQIRNADYNDSGSYVCTATNVLGQVKKAVKLSVEGKIIWKENKQMLKILSSKTWHIAGQASRNSGGGDTPYKGLYGRAPPERYIKMISRRNTVKSILIQAF